MFKRILVAATSAVFAVGGLASPAVATLPADIICIAHRGGETSHTEQTAFSYTTALTAGVPEVEGDVRWTSTGYPYMLHDSDMGLFGHPTVALSSISGSTATGPTYESVTGDKILSLYALRQQLVASPTTRTQLELKTVLTEAQWTMLATRLNPIKDRTTLTSFNKDTVQAAQEHGYRTGLLSSTFDETTEAPTFAINYNALEPDDVDIHKRVGVDTQTWTINTVAQWNDAASAGVTAIITDDPVGCMAWTEGN